MGFTVKPTVFHLKFEDDRFDGLEIEAKSMPLAEFFALQELQAKAGQDVAAGKEVIRRMGGAITGWNLEDEQGSPIKANADSLEQLEIGFAMAILDAWMEAIASVPNHSKGGSNGGETSLERSIQMDLSSPSPGS